MDQKNTKNILDLFEKIKEESKLEQCKETKNEKNKEKSNNEEKTISNIEKLEQEFTNLIDENAKLIEDKLIAVADNQNTVRRFQNESILVRKYGGEKLATELLPAIDMFRSVLKSTPDSLEIKNYLTGFEMIINQIDQALWNSGISIIQVKPGEIFNPDLHTAIEQIETEQFPSGRIASVVSNGYKLHDRVIKHVAVKVAK